MLYQKYRPQDLDSLLGNEKVVQGLKALFDGTDEPPHAYLLTGPTGCGKTTTARIIANCLGCVGNDFREVDSADFRGIDSIREIRKNAYFKPLEGKTRVWLIDECHKLTSDAQNAMLKLLEDPPETSYFILATTDPEKLIKTVKGRCLHYEVGLLEEPDMRKLLKKIARAEGAKVPQEVILQIVEDAYGHPRNAIQILEQVIHVEESKMLDYARQAAETQSKTIELCRALFGRESWQNIAKILKSLKEQGEDPEGLRRAVLGYCQSVLLNKEDIRAAVIMECFSDNVYNTGFPGLVLMAFSAMHSD